MKPFPLSVLNLSVVGIPVVASAVGGILSIIDETNGILLNNESVETWSNAMEEIFKHSKRIR